MLIVPEVNELWSGHEYSFHSSGNKSEMRFHDAAMATRNLMNQLEEVGIINKEKIKVRVSNSTL
jgi:ribosomal protein S19E (S16A)